MIFPLNCLLLIKFYKGHDKKSASNQPCYITKFNQKVNTFFPVIREELPMISRVWMQFNFDGHQVENSKNKKPNPKSVRLLADKFQYPIL